MKTEFEGRTFRFALAAIRLTATFPRSIAGSVIARQLLKSATAVGANYREAQRAESKADFVHKLAIAEKEAAESEYWLLLCQEAVLAVNVTALLAESREILSILVAMGRTAKRRRA